MRRRDLLGALAATAFPGALLEASRAQAQDRAADFTLEIGPVTVELAPGTTVKTLGYNGSAPGPLLRIPEGKTVSIEVHNNTSEEEVVHWHGLHIPSDVDGARRRYTRDSSAGRRRYSFTATPSGTRWYHSHTMAGRNLKRATYTGQFGFLYVEPKSDPGAYDQELALKEWDPYMSTAGDDEGSMDAAYKHFSINDRAFGHAAPIRVHERQRVLFRIINARGT